MLLRIAFEDWRVFCQLATEGSITGAARLLETDPSNLKRRLDALEEALQMQLFIRGRNGLTMTVAGRNLYARVRPLVDETLSVLGRQHDVASLEASPHTLTVALPRWVGDAWLEPALLALRQPYPLLTVNVVLVEDERQLDVLQPDLWIDSHSDLSRTAIRLKAPKTVLCATSTYLETAGTPSNPEDLRQHTLLTWGKTHSDRVILVKEAERFPVTVRRHTTMPSLDGLIVKLLNHEGVAAGLPWAHFKRLASEHKLVHLMPERSLYLPPLALHRRADASDDAILLASLTALQNAWEQAYG